MTNTRPCYRCGHNTGSDDDDACPQCWKWMIARHKLKGWLDTEQTKHNVRTRYTMRYKNQTVKIALTTTKDTYIGTLIETDQQFVYLTNYTYGWQGEAGFWNHGNGTDIAFPLTTIKTIQPNTP